MFAAFPLLILPFILYNAGMLASVGRPESDVLRDNVISLNMLSGAVWSMSIGDTLIVVALAMLFFEIIKATRNSSGSLLNHMFSMVAFIAYLVEFLLVRDAATQIFFILMMIALIDVIAGFTISIRTAGRDVSIGL